MTLVFLAADHRTLITKHADHVHIIATDDDDEQATYYEPVYFVLDGGMLILATSSWALQHYGRFLGVIDDGSDPEQLREAADRETLAALNAGQVGAQ